MPIFNLAKFNSATAKPKGLYSSLLTTLDIKENQLKADGKLSPGDYDLLAAEARKIALAPGLTPAERDQALVKVSQYTSQKSSTSLADSENVDRMNRESKDDFTKNNMLFGNNPQTLLQANAASLQAKLNQLSDSISQIDSAGGDSSLHSNEFASTLNEYNDTLKALDQARAYKAGSGQPASDFVSYVTTNSNGEVTDVKVGRPGSISGYRETNGVYGGFRMYAKTNGQQDGKSYVRVGNNRFSAADVLTPDPQNPLSFKTNPLISDDMQSQGNVSVAQKGQYKDVDLSQVRPQSSIPSGMWAKGSNGTLYQRKDDGSFKKYVNVDQGKLGIKDNDILSIPKVFEQSILNNVNETVDGANVPPPAPQSFQAAPPPAQSATSAPTSTPVLGQGLPKDNAPVQRAPSSIGGVANNLYQGAKSFLGSIFNR